MPRAVIFLFITIGCFLLMQQDQFGRLLPTFIQVIDFTEQEESEYWAIMSAISEGKQIDFATSRMNAESVASISTDAGINTKVLF